MGTFVLKLQKNYSLMTIFEILCGITYFNTILAFMKKVK